MPDSAINYATFLIPPVLGAVLQAVLGGWVLRPPRVPPDFLRHASCAQQWDRLAQAILRRIAPGMGFAVSCVGVMVNLAVGIGGERQYPNSWWLEHPTMFFYVVWVFLVLLLFCGVTAGSGVLFRLEALRKYKYVVPGPARENPKDALNDLQEFATDSLWARGLMLGVAWSLFGIALFATT